MIETDRLILRPFVPDDAEDVYEYLREPPASCFASMRLDTPDAARALVKERGAEQEYCFAIVLKDSGKVVGEISACPEPGVRGEAPDTFSPCWMLNKEYRGKGYAYEAARAFFGYLFFQKGARRICAYTEAGNTSSQRLCGRLGMRQEGLFKEFISFVRDENGEPVYEDTAEWAILRKEWSAALRPSRGLLSGHIPAFFCIFCQIREPWPLPAP